MCHPEPLLSTMFNNLYHHTQQRFRTTYYIYTIGYNKPAALRNICPSILLLSGFRHLFSLLSPLGGTNSKTKTLNHLRKRNYIQIRTEMHPSTQTSHSNWLQVILEVRIPPSGLWYLSNNNFSEVATAPWPDTLITGAGQSEESCGFSEKASCVRIRVPSHE